MTNLFSPNMLVKINNVDNSILSLNNPEGSFFTNALNDILNIKKEVNENSRILYKKILESEGDYNYVNEAFSDFFNNIVRLINKFINSIKKMENDFINSVTNICNDEFIKSNIKLLESFTEIDSFRMDIFEYTFKKNIPYIDALNDFKEDFTFIKYPSDIKRIYNVFNDRLLDNYYDKFNALILGLDDNISIPSGELAYALYTTYRNGKSVKQDTLITPEIIENSLNEFLSNKDVSYMVEKIESQFNEIKDFMKATTNIKYGINIAMDNIMESIEEWKDSKLNKEHTNYLNLFIKAKASQIEQMCTTYSLAFGAKFDALRESYIQHRSILYKAINEMSR